MPSKNNGSGGARRVKTSKSKPRADAAPAPRFTPKQLAAIELLTTEPNETQDYYAEQLKVDRKTLLTWRKLDGFGEALIARARELFAEHAPRMFKALTDKAATGDVQALKMYFQMIGELAEDTPGGVNVTIHYPEQPEMETNGSGDRATIINRLKG